MSSDPGRVTIEEGIVFGAGAGRDLRLDVYTPPARAEGGPGVLLVHGGGWREGDRSQLKGYGILLGRMGYTSVACEYRLTPESPWPAQIHDVKAALRWMKANSDQLGIDPDHVAVSGNSAGGHLSLMVAGTANVPEFEGDGGNPGVDTSVAACISFYGPAAFLSPKDDGSRPLEFSEASGALFGPNPDREVVRRAGPCSHVGPHWPPTLLLHGTKDDLVPWDNSTGMFEALLKAGVPAEVHIYADEPHAFDAASAFGRQSAAIMDLFLRRFVVARAKQPVGAA